MPHYLTPSSVIVTFLYQFVSGGGLQWRTEGRGGGGAGGGGGGAVAPGAAPRGRQNGVQKKTIFTYKSFKCVQIA